MSTHDSAMHDALMRVLKTPVMQDAIENLVRSRTLSYRLNDLKDMLELCPDALFVPDNSPLDVVRYKGWDGHSVDPFCFQCEHRAVSHMTDGYTHPKSSQINFEFPVIACQNGCQCTYFSPSFILPADEDLADSMYDRIQRSARQRGA